MSTKYFALLTQLGADKLANAAALGTKIEITHMAVGDGGGSLPTPDTKQAKLINEKRRAAINTLSIDPKNTNQIISEQIIPENEGGWWIREIGLFDKDGILIAVGNCAETYKPQLQEGSGRTQTIRMILIVSSTESVTLKVDPSVVLATREYVDDSIQENVNSNNQQFKTLIESNHRLNDTVAEIDSKVNKADNQFNQLKTNIQEYIPLPLNLFSNAMMRSVEQEGYPTKYTAVGCTIKAVHPWTKGFEGCYTEIAPSNVAPDPESAGEGKPYWYGRYNLGDRMGRGGLAGGWGGIDSGNILKITSTASTGHQFFRVPVETFGVFSQLGLRFWVKIVKGKLGMGVDSGYHSENYRYLGNDVIEKTETDAAKDGWLLVNKVINISQVTSLAGNVLNFGLPDDEDCEIYLALPYLYVPMAGKTMTVAAGETGGSPVFTPGNPES
ncbi:phage tail protein [Xenorhabdus bovienii]|uniref:phage tail protein n=1 Tax=Xenorhabdus bovienii TaxID=40576 RepID=UPI0023B3323E|nr:phage tail protein [Xenorhabdus bovienii]